MKRPAVSLWEIVPVFNLHNANFPASPEHNERNCYIRCLYPRGFADDATVDVGGGEQSSTSGVGGHDINGVGGVEANGQLQPKINKLYLTCDGLRLRITANERERSCFTLERHADGSEKVAFEHYYVREESGVYNLTTNESHASRFRLQWQFSEDGTASSDMAS